MKRIVEVFSVWLVLVLSAHAASFDCAKARTKVEHLICGNAELSKLDDQLGAKYDAVLKDKTKTKIIRQTQRAWLRERNGCADAQCVEQAYRSRIIELSIKRNATGEGVPNQAKVSPQVAQQKQAGSHLTNKESYVLVMSKDDELCNHMLNEFNADLKKYGWNGDAYQEEHEEFKQVHWEPARFSSVINGRTEYTDVEGALFDFNNDGIQDFVVRWKAYLSEMRADLLVMFDAETASRKDSLVSKDFWDARNRIFLAGYGYWSSTLPEVVTDARVLEPFIYRGTSYLVMRDLFEKVRTLAGYAVIAKYGGGKFVAKNVTGKMEDVCYFKRIGAKRKR